jgi:hypothetical protein
MSSPSFLWEYPGEVALEKHEAFLLGAARAQEMLAVTLERQGNFVYADRAWARANAIRGRADAAHQRLEHQRAQSRSPKAATG